MRTNEVYLRHILDAIEQINEYVNGSGWTGHRRPGRTARRRAPFQAFSEQGGAEVLKLSSQELRGIQVCAQAIETWREAWHTGCGRRVDRGALEGTEAVSSTFMDRVAALAEKYDGEASLIIEALRKGEVKRFHGSKTVELEAYFEREGYIEHAPQLTEEEIQARVLASVQEALAKEVISSHDVWTLFDRLKNGVGS